MKRIIYTAVALIVCASVFGIADYFNAKKQGALVNYTDEVQPAETVIPEKKKEISAATKEAIQTPGTRKEFKKQTRAEKKVARTKTKNAYYTELIPMAVTEKTTEPVAEKVVAVDVVLQSKTTDADDSVIQTSEKRKIKMEMFSRAPIREKKLKRK